VAVRRGDEGGGGGGGAGERVLGRRRRRLDPGVERARPDRRGLVGVHRRWCGPRVPRRQGAARRGCNSRSVIDVERARRETPGVEHVVHLNNAGSSLMPQPVLEATLGHLELEARIGGYEAHAENEEAIDRFYCGVAELIGAKRDEIAFCSSATRAWDMAFYGFRF